MSAPSGARRDPIERPPAFVPSIDDQGRLMLLPPVLSLTAGSADAISFLGLGGLFVAHITGNLIILAAHLVTGAPVAAAAVLSVPVFTLALILTRLFVARLDAAGTASLRPLLLQQVALLAGFLALAVSPAARRDPVSAAALAAGMLGVAAMATQNALVRVSLRDAPSTAVMTTNLTVLTMDAGELLFGRGSANVEKARRRARHTWPSVAGFAAGAALGAALYAAIGMWSLALPSGLALVGVVLASEASVPRSHPDGRPRERREDVTTAKT